MSNLKIGDKIRAKRRERNLTQEELANKLFVSKAAVSKWENEESYPDITMIPQIAQIFHITIIHERHRNRYEFNNDYRERLESAGLRVASINPKRNFVEIVEVKNHPWMVGVQFHPEFQSKPSKPHPIFCAFVGEALKKASK